MATLRAETRTIDAAGLTVCCHVSGPEGAPPVVLVHGAGPDAAAVSWRQTVPALADAYRVYAPDLPGYGESARVPPAVTPTTDFYIRVVDTLLEELDLDEVTLVGISKGGGIALGYTLAHPDRVARLGLVDSFGLGNRVPGGRKTAVLVRIPTLLEGSWWAMKRSRTVTKRSLGAVARPENVDAAFVDDVYRALRRPNSSDAYFRWARAELHLTGPRTNYADRLSALAVPTLLVHGADDPLIPPALSARAARVIPVADLVVVERCGHWVSRERANVFVAELTAWLDRRVSTT